MEKDEGAERAADEGSEGDLKMVLGLPLSDAEARSVGRIVAYWGLIEHEIFEQTLAIISEDADVPAELLSNRDFPAIQKLWRERVIAETDDIRRLVLEQQDCRISHYHEFRAPIVHAMWDWDPSQPGVVISTRVTKKRIETVRFKTDDLSGMAHALGEILYWITYPGGLVDQAAALRGGGGMSRHFFALLTGDPNAERYLPEEIREGLKPPRTSSPRRKL